MTFNKRYYILALALSLSVLLETLCFTYMQQLGSMTYFSSSILYVLSGLAICIIPLIPIGTGREIKGVSVLIKYTPYVMALSLLAIVAYHLYILRPIYHHSAPDPWADMIPCIRVACRRFLHGETVYAPASEIWAGSIIPYLPMMWGPFLPAAIFKFDYRWITVALQFGAICLTAVPFLSRRKNVPVLPLVISVTALFLLLNYILVKQVDYWFMTEEGVVAGLYLLLGLALLRKNYWIIGLAMMACTLSRYSLMFWIPVYFAYVLFTQSRKDFLKLFVSYTVSMLAIFVLPFFVRNPQYFIHIPDTYLALNLRFWQERHLEQHLFFNVGLFKFFTAKQLHTMFVVEIVTSLLAPAILIGAAYMIKRKCAINEKYLGYASLKISLIFFYGFIQMPYIYILVPPTLISYAILFDYLAVQQRKQEVTSV